MRYRPPVQCVQAIARRPWRRAPRVAGDSSPPGDADATCARAAVGRRGNPQGEAVHQPAVTAPPSEVPGTPGPTAHDHPLPRTAIHRIYARSPVEAHETPVTISCRTSLTVAASVLRALASSSRQQQLSDRVRGAGGFRGKAAKRRLRQLSHSCVRHAAPEVEIVRRPRNRRPRRLRGIGLDQIVAKRVTRRARTDWTARAFAGWM